jgi:predicted Zn-dependent peptidase
MQFIICGDLSERKEKIIDMLEAWKLPEGERLDFPKTDYHQAKPVLIRRKDASNLSFGFSFMLNRALCSNEQESMGALNHILNGTMSSKIFGTARHRGIVYGMGSNTSCDSLASNWDFDGEVNVENAEELFLLIQKELMRTLNGEISDKDFDAAKSYALGRFQMGAQTVGQVADYYAENYFVNEGVVKYDTVPNLIRGIDKAKMIELAREFAGSGIKGFATVSSVEKAVISGLETHLNF